MHRLSSVNVLEWRDDLGKASLPRGSWDLAHPSLGGVTGHGSAERRERSLEFRLAYSCPCGTCLARGIPQGHGLAAVLSL